MPETEVPDIGELELSNEQKLILDVLSALQTGIITGNITSLGIIAINGKEQFGGVGVFAYPASMNGVEILGMANLYKTSVERMIFTEQTHPQAINKSKLN